MKDVAQRLREADPLIDEGAWSAAERQRVRQALLVANAGAARTSRRAFTYGFSVAAAGIVAIVAGLEWPRAPLMAAVRFEIRLAEEAPGLELEPATVRESGERVYLHRQTILTNGDIVSAETVQDPSGSASVVVKFARDGSARLLQITRLNAGRRLAILLDGHAVIAPVIRSPIGTSAVIGGGLSRAEADRIAAGILGR
ncbi:MAG TPA: hypothetical protein VH417_19820 [Vicinamibacterales bacterium]|jgi:hypothetical protein